VLRHEISVAKSDEPLHNAVGALERATNRTGIGDTSVQDPRVARRYIASLLSAANDVVNIEAQSYSTYHAAPAGKEIAKVLCAYMIEH
jgi:hypothetical protein